MPPALWQLLLPDTAAPEGLIFAGIVPAGLLPQLAGLAIKENRWY